MRFLSFVFYYILGVLGIVAVSTSPMLFMTNQVVEQSRITTYFSAIGQLFKDIFQSDKWVYHVENYQLSIMDTLWEPYLYSIKVLLAALVLGFFIAFVLAIITVFLPNPALRVVKRTLNLLEAIPDLLVAILLQLIVITIVRETDVLVMRFVAYREDIYLAPIIVLSIVPMITLYRVILLLIEEELQKEYVEFVKSKGIKHQLIILVHVLRNIMKSVFFHTKIIVWGVLSSLFVIEYIFNMDGVTNYILEDFRPIVIAVVLMLIFTPFYIFYQGIEMILWKDSLHQETINNRPKLSLSIPRFRWNWKHVNVLSWSKRLVKELWVHLKNPKFLFGFLVILSIFSYSVMYSNLVDVPIKKIGLLFGDDGELLGAPPHSPSTYAWLGTDQVGFSILGQMSVGAKYTIFFAVLIAFLRMALGFLLAIPYAMVIPTRIQKGIERFVDSLHFLPLTIVAYVILSPILTGRGGGFMYSFPDRVVIEVVVLTILAIPLVTVLIGNEMKLLMNNEFITGARIMGGGSGHILFRHMLPHLGSRLALTFGQQFIQVLVVFIHLGVFDIFFGGTIMNGFLSEDPPRSFTNEWSGLIGGAMYAFRSGHEWMILPPLIGFMILIVAMQYIMEGIKEVQQQRVGVPVEKSQLYKRLFRKKKASKSIVKKQQNEDFSFVHRQKTL